MIGDLTEPQYVMRRQALEEELQRTAPPTNPDLDRAQALLENFARFGDTEPNPTERHKLIRTLFAQIWAKDRQIVAVKPNPAFAPYFLTATEAQAKRQQHEPSDEATMTGATGVGHSSGTASRSGDGGDDSGRQPRHGGGGLGARA